MSRTQRGGSYIGTIVAVNRNGNRTSLGICGLVLLLCSSFAAGSSAAEPDEMKIAPPPPRIIKTIPAVGATNVSVKTAELTVVFDQDMLPGYSWTAGPHFPKVEGDPVWRDKRTCILPVKLERGKFYRVGINSSDEKFQNFTNEFGDPAFPCVIRFVTEGATDAEKSRTIPPRVISTSPVKDAENVDPSMEQIIVIFDKPMSRGMSWTGFGVSFPQGDGVAHWKDDQRTCVFPVKLHPNAEYIFGINDDWHLNFQSADGVPVEPAVIRFKTKQKQSERP